MPDHTSGLTYLLGYMRETLEHNASIAGRSLIGKHEPTWQSWEPLAMSLIVALVLLLVGVSVRSKLADPRKAIVPDDRLTLRTFVEAFLGYFYDLAKSVMGPVRAKKYFPVIGAGACFVFLCNVMSLIPGMPVATTSLNITMGSALVVFILFNIYGFIENGWGYLKHLAGPVLLIAPLIFVIELISLLVRPITLAVRLMLNLAIDHLLLAIFMGLIPLLLPLPLMVLGIVVVIIQTLVFALLTTIYIGLATEHEEHH
jgi:F-type H+-transporting ATPase subunit a